MDSLVLAFCFLPLDNAIFRTVFVDLAGSLKKRGLELVVFASETSLPLFSEETIDNAYRLVTIPLQLKKYNRFLSPGRQVSVVNTMGPLRDEIAMLDRFWQTHNRFEALSVPQTDHGAVAAAETFWLDALGILRPRCVLLWGTTTSLMKLVRLICLEQTIPAYMIERGQLPDSLFVDRFGQFAHSDFVDQDLEDPEAYAVPLESYATAIRGLAQKYPAMNQELAASPWNDGPGRRVLFLGTYALASGTHPAVFWDNAIQNYGFKTQEQAYEAVRDFCKKEGHRLIAKGHPADPIIGLPKDDLQKASIDDLLRFADVVVCMQTNVTILALALGKPCVICGPTYLNRRGAAFEATDEPTLYLALEQACGPNGVPDAQIPRRQEFLRAYFRRKHYSAEGKETAIGPRTFLDLADRLARMPGFPGDIDSTARWAEFRESLVCWEAETRVKAENAVLEERCRRLQEECEAAIAARSELEAEVARLSWEREEFRTLCHSLIGSAPAESGPLTSAPPAMDAARAGFCQELAARLSQAGRLRAALGLLGEAIVMAPRQHDLYQDLAACLWSLGHRDAAIEADRKAVELVPDHIGHIVRLGLRLVECGRAEEAAILFRGTLEKHPGSSEVHNGLSITLRVLGEVVGAIDSLRTAIALNPDNPQWPKDLEALEAQT